MFMSEEALDNKDVLVFFVKLQTLLASLFAISASFHHLRFLMKIKLPWLQCASNPSAINSAISLGFSETLTTNFWSGPPVWKNTCSILM